MEREEGDQKEARIFNKYNMKTSEWAFFFAFVFSNSSMVILQFVKLSSINLILKKYCQLKVKKGVMQ